MGAEVKNLGKDIVETWSGEYGFIFVLAKMQSVVNLGGIWLGKCVECDVEYPIYNVFEFVFVATHRKRKNEEAEE